MKKELLLSSLLAASSVSMIIDATDLKASGNIDKSLTQDQSNQKITVQNILYFAAVTDSCSGGQSYN